MATSTKTSIELPKQPKEKEFEEYVAAFLQCAGLYIERNIVERDIREVLELDVIASNYDQCPPDIRLIEIKSGGWGFPEVFKIFGWLKYLDISHGALVVKESKETDQAQQFYNAKAKDLGIDLVVVDPSGQAGSALDELLGHKHVDEGDLSFWRFSYWMERNLLRRLVSKKKSLPKAKRFSAMDDYIFAVNSGVFFTKGAVERARKLYSAFQSCPRISAKCANEEIGNDFDDDVETIDNSLFTKSFYGCEYTDIQISTYIEHRARLAILKSGIDHILYEQAGEKNKAGAKTKRLLGFDFANAPQSFLEGLGEIAQHKHFHRYPVFWQWFMWLFGGFILRDLEQQEYEHLAARTGIPVDEIPAALSSYGILFPQADGWFRDEPHSNVRVMKMFPVPLMGIGANLRKHLYTSEGKYSDLKVKGQYTVADLVKWNNLAVTVLAQC
jgi:hypothetical protein